MHSWLIYPHKVEKHLKMFIIQLADNYIGYTFVQILVNRMPLDLKKNNGSAFKVMSRATHFWTNIVFLPRFLIGQPG